MKLIYKKGGFIGFDAVNKKIADGVEKKRVGFVIEQGPPARDGVEITFADQKVGVITSGSPSPSLKKGIGMAYVNSEHAKVGTVLQGCVRGKTFDLIISKMPFVPARYYRKTI